MRLGDKGEGKEKGKKQMATHIPPRHRARTIPAFLESISRLGIQLADASPLASIRYWLQLRKLLEELLLFHALERAVPIRCCL